MSSEETDLINLSWYGLNIGTSLAGKQKNFSSTKQRASLWSKITV